MVNKSLLLSDDKYYAFKSTSVVHVTNMTSNTAPSPFVVSASSEYPSTEAYRAFGGQGSWATGTGENPAWIKIDMGSKKKANKVKINYDNGGAGISSAPKDFKILGSNDDSVFDAVLQTTNLTNWTLNEDKYFDLSSTVDYRYYKLEISSNNGGSYFSVSDISFILQGSVLREIPSQSERNLMEYGMDASSELDLTTEMTNVAFIEQISAPLDGGKVFKKKIDTAKTPITKMSIE